MVTRQKPSIVTPQVYHGRSRESRGEGRWPRTEVHGCRWYSEVWANFQRVFKMFFSPEFPVWYAAYIPPFWIFLASYIRQKAHLVLLVVALVPVIVVLLIVVIYHLDSFPIVREDMRQTPFSIHVFTLLVLHQWLFSLTWQTHMLKSSPFFSRSGLLKPSPTAGVLD